MTIILEKEEEAVVWGNYVIPVFIKVKMSCVWNLDDKWAFHPTLFPEVRMRGWREEEKQREGSDCLYPPEGALSCTSEQQITEWHQSPWSIWMIMWLCLSVVGKTDLIRLLVHFYMSVIFNGACVLETWCISLTAHRTLLLYYQNNHP